jgi:hypothetical protein
MLSSPPSARLMAAAISRSMACRRSRDLVPAPPSLDLPAALAIGEHVEEPAREVTARGVEPQHFLTDPAHRGDALVAGDGTCRLPVVETELLGVMTMNLRRQALPVLNANRGEWVPVRTWRRGPL